MTWGDDASQKGAAVSKRCHRIRAVGKTIDCSDSSVRRLIRKGLLDVIYIGSSVRVTDESLEKLLQSGTRCSSR